MMPVCADYNPMLDRQGEIPKVDSCLHCSQHRWHDKLGLWCKKSGELL